MTIEFLEKNEKSFSSYSNINGKMNQSSKKLHKDRDYFYLGDSTKTYSNTSRAFLFLKTLVKTLGSIFLALISESVREDWKAVFTGKKVVQLYCPTLSTYHKFLTQHQDATPDQYVELGNAYDGKLEHQKALKCYQKAVEDKHPNDLFSQSMELGNLYESKKDTEKALEYYQKAMKLKYPNSLYDQYIGLGDLYEDKGKPEEAEKYYKLAIKHEQPNASEETRNLSLALLYTKKGKTDLAEKYFPKPSTPPTEVKVDPLLIHKIKLQIAAPKVSHWLRAAEKHPILMHTDLYKTLKRMQNEELNEKSISSYDKHKNEIARILFTSENNFYKLLERQENEFIFHLLKNDEFEIKSLGENLTNYEEEKNYYQPAFKTQLTALFNIISKPSPTPIIEEQSSIIEKEEIKEISTESELKKEKTIRFGDFQKEISENSDAKEAFTACVEIIKKAINTENNKEALKTELTRYNSAQDKLWKLIPQLNEPLKKIRNINKETPIADILRELNNVFKEFSNPLGYIKNSPSLKDLLIQNVHASGVYTFLNNENENLSKMRILSEENNKIKQEILTALNNLENHLEAKDQDKLSSIISLGQDILREPEKVFNQYLRFEKAIGFQPVPPDDSSNISAFLEKVDSYVEAQDFSAENLLALEAFTLVALYSYIINPQTKLDPSFQLIIHKLTGIRAVVLKKISQNDGVNELRNHKGNQIFYKLIKEKMENTPSYPKNFWFDPNIAQNMKIEGDLLQILGMKITAPSQTLKEPAELVHKNEKIGYEIYFYPGSENEKPKLLLFLTKPTGYALTQEMNHHIGIFGDPTILKQSQEVISNILSTGVLEGYDQDLKEGKLDVIASGFDNSGAAATVVANKIALAYPKTKIISIAAASTPFATTEDAYNMNQAENFFPIRLQYAKDRSVNRVNVFGDFSEDSYYTFPLVVQYDANLIDINKHNKEEYGNTDNFIPAMTYPLIVKDLYQLVSDQIIYDKKILPKQTQKTEKNLPPPRMDSKVSVFFNIKLPEIPKLKIGQLDRLIQLGEKMLANVERYKGVFLKFEQTTLSEVDKSSVLEEIEKNQSQQKEVSPGFFGWMFGAKQSTEVPLPMQEQILSLEEQKNTIYALQQTVLHLKNPDVMKLIQPEHAFYLLVVSNTLFVNYTKINTNVGHFPQLLDLINEIRQLSNERLKDLYRNENTKKEVEALINNKSSELGQLASRAKLNDQYAVLDKIDFEDRFLEFLGFKIAKTSEDKPGSSGYVSKLHADNKKEKYDISLFTPEDPKKKQRIVICCNGEDTLGKHALMDGDFGAGDSLILNRAKKLSDILDEKLKGVQGLDLNEIDIVVTGFGSEGAVATALGYYLAGKYPKNQVQSIGFGAPRFTTAMGAQTIQKRKNFVPLRFLSPADTRFEAKLNPLSGYPLSENTYYTIPLQFRIQGVLELGGHNRNLYGDIQSIKTSMKTGYRLREVANENKKLESLQKAIKKEPEIVPSLPKRFIIDTRRTDLTEFSKKNAGELQKIEPGKLIQTMKYCVELSEKKEISKEDETLIKNFFNAFIEAIKNTDTNEKPSIPNSFCKNMMNHGYNPGQLFGGKWTLQKIISKDLAEAMEAVDKMDKNIPSKEKEELILKRSYWRGILAGDLNGNRYKPAGGGVNGAVFFRHLEFGIKDNKVLLASEKEHLPFLGVFKPHPDTVKDRKGLFDLAGLGERWKAVFGMESRLNQKDEDKRVHNEIFAYELFHIFGFNEHVKFPTTLKVINKNDEKNRPASFCAFMPGYDTVALHEGGPNTKTDVLYKKRLYSDNELYIWQMSKIFDFLTGNMDGHGGNAFVKIDSKGELVDAVNFDYDKAFATEKTPKIGNQYKWAKLNISKQAFNNKALKALEKMLDENTLESKIKKFLEIARDHNENKFTKEQEKLLRERIDILKQIIKKEIKKLSKLRKFR